MTDPHRPTTLDYLSPPKRAGLPRAVATAITFVIALIASTVVCTVLWQSCVTDVLYHCSDPGWLDYLEGPGGWVHGAAAGQPGNFGDSIRPGWTMWHLKAMWYASIIASVGISAFVSRLRWFRIPLFSV